MWFLKNCFFFYVLEVYTYISIISYLSNRSTTRARYASRRFPQWGVLHSLLCWWLWMHIKIMERVLGRLHLSAANNGLGVNSTKMEQILFTIKTRITQFWLTSVSGTTITLCFTAKYLEVEIGTKLNWSMNIKKRKTKAYLVFYNYLLILSMNWDLQPNDGLVASFKDQDIRQLL